MHAKCPVHANSKGACIMIVNDRNLANIPHQIEMAMGDDHQ
jgi:hypothetical protein